MSDLTNNRISNNVSKAVLPTETSTDTVKPVQRTTPIQEPHLCETKATTKLYLAIKLETNKVTMHKK